MVVPIYIYICVTRSTDFLKKDKTPHLGQYRFYQNSIGSKKKKKTNEMTNTNIPNLWRRTKISILGRIGCIQGNYARNLTQALLARPGLVWGRGGIFPSARKQLSVDQLLLKNLNAKKFTTKQLSLEVHICSYPCT